jgi:recombination protein RecR
MEPVAYDSEALTALVAEFMKLPGIGRKSAQRIAFHLLKAPKDEALSLAQAVEGLKEKVRLCSVCFTLTEKDPCAICQHDGRDRGVICVVEEPADALSLERTKEYRGLYHVLGGALSPLDGIGPDQLRFRELLARLEGDSVREVIVATNPTTEGEATALYLAKVIRPQGIRVTRIARGLPVGSALDLADEVTLKRSLEGRTEL